MPLQLLNLGVLIPRMFYRLFITRTPRDYAELNAPPMINYGVVYPQAILIFIITLLHSVIQPLILVFGAVYFGVGYVVYKYKLLFGQFLVPCNLLPSGCYSRSNSQFSISHMNRKVKPGLSPSSASFGVLSYSSLS